MKIERYFSVALLKFHSPFKASFEYLQIDLVAFKHKFLQQKLYSYRNSWEKNGKKNWQAKTKSVILFHFNDVTHNLTDKTGAKPNQNH